MKFTRYIILSLYLVLLYSNCVQEFRPESQGFEEILVVEAFLSNSDENFNVKLSRSMPIDVSDFYPESGATVSLLSSSNEEYTLFETNPGTYQSYNPIYPQVGNDYQLQIRTSNGSQYASEFVTMRETPEIDSVTYEFKENNAGTLGIQIEVSTHDPLNNTWYYRWEYTEDWVFYTPYYSLLYWENEEIFVREQNINQCWLNDQSTSVQIATTKNLSQDIVYKYPLVFVSEKTDRLANHYSIGVKQYGLSEEAYNYWNELEKTTESLGTLFDPQPSIVNGNISNVNDPSEVVLGYFDVAEVQNERIFVRRSDLPRITVPYIYSYCTDSLVVFDEIPNMMGFGYLLVTETMSETGATVYQMSPRNCVDCTLRGSNVKPDFWP